MIEQIKGMLEFSKLSIDSFNVEVSITPDFIDRMLYVISEIERLKVDIDLMVSRHRHDIQITNQHRYQLQNALIEISEYTNPTGEDGREMIIIAREALKEGEEK